MSYLPDLNKICNYTFYYNGGLNKQKYEPQATASDLPPDIRATREDILAMILDIDTHKAAGPDGLPNLVLRRYAEQMSLTVFNESIYLIPGNGRDS